MSSMFKLKHNQIHSCLTNKSLIFYFLFILLTICLISSKCALSKLRQDKVSINGSGLKIPRMVSLKNSLTYMRSGPGKEFPVKFELRQIGYPLKIVAEFYNWRKVTTINDVSGWIHTQLLSSFKTGLITKTTFLRKVPSNSSISLAKLLPNLIVNIKKCKGEWCKIEVTRKKVFVGWIRKESIWGQL